MIYYEVSFPDYIDRNANDHVPKVFDRPDRLIESPVLVSNFKSYSSILVHCARNYLFLRDFQEKVCYLSEIESSIPGIGKWGLLRSISSYYDLTFEFK